MKIKQFKMGQYGIIQIWRELVYNPISGGITSENFGILWNLIITNKKSF